MDTVWDRLCADLRPPPPATPARDTPLLQPPPLTPGSRTVQHAAHAEWKASLDSHVEVDGVGTLPVIKVLQEVTALCLWPSVIIALGMPSDPASQARVAPPSAQSALSLQQLYNLTIRHWEPSIFSGLLGAYASGTMPPPVAQSMDRAFQSHHYGPSTPMREADLTQWINLTPGAWSAQHDPFIGNGGQNTLFPRKSSLASTAFPFPFQLDDEKKPAEQDEQASTEDDNHVAGLDELLAGMEDQRNDVQHDIKPVENTTIQTFNLPTPETTSSDSPTTTSNKMVFSPPTTLSSPFVTAGSSISAAPVPAPVPAKPHTKARPPQLSMPPVDFVPPPPMCMFFKSAFDNLTDGKVGIWKGDLEVRGRGGGKFSVLVVGEQGFDHLWQSTAWPQQLSYPMRSVSDNDCYTSSMIPVSHLAREGLVPITMGMVLCNEPADRIDPYVKMVHGLHAEGVAFHLPCDNPRLPVVFLPAKFHANDPLLRLGVAFMGKAGLPYPAAPLPQPTNQDAEESGADEPARKKRRQSAPVPSKSKSRKGSKD
ncbi:hypothetical protein L202_02350 [Cryptococcus amylolentus CBS 6039]|uniref:Uncharacterized protein n=1 Tax=Cryptococcus amylolentus CBS 6039 TaxID=1295533 RepID=A0A1E3I075_9TREE|nr:hypothetical protein L202_02350 [Cryptococcus amylolentus CBS 6039]ODN82024.1 hypothetical protein L202_02350 [Cryptococcus amylolentus CBS 6039]